MYYGPEHELGGLGGVDRGWLKSTSTFYFDGIEANFYEKLLEDDCEEIDTTNVIVVDFKNKKVLSR